MTIGDRIKSRRMKLGLSAGDLALIIKKDRATVYRYESSEIEKLPIGIIEPLSKVLECSPAYLMGWTDCPNLDIHNTSLQPSFTSHELKLIEAYRSNPTMQSAVDKLLGIEEQAETINKKDA